MNQDSINMATFAELQDNAGAEFVAELVIAFLEEAPPMLAELRSALAAQQSDVFRRAAHSLKSNSSAFGADVMSEMARGLELSGLPADAQGIDALEAEYQRVAARLTELSNG